MSLSRMSLSRMTFSLLSAVGGLAFAAAALLLSAGPAAAQQPGSGPQIPPGTRAYQAFVIRQEYWQRQYAQRSSAPARPGPQASSPRRASPAYSVTVAVGPTRREPTPVYVTLEGPNGGVRRFPLEGGPEAIRTRALTVRAGEKVTLRFLTSAPAR